MLCIATSRVRSWFKKELWSESDDLESELPDFVPDCRQVWRRTAAPTWVVYVPIPVLFAARNSLINNWLKSFEVQLWVLSRYYRNQHGITIWMTPLSALNIWRNYCSVILPWPLEVINFDGWSFLVVVKFHHLCCHDFARDDMIFQHLLSWIISSSDSTVPSGNLEKAPHQSYKTILWRVRVL